MKKSEQGFSVIEVLLAIAILTLFFGSLNYYYARALNVSENTTYRIQSGYLLEEGINILRLFRDSGWNTTIKPLSTTTTYYLLWNGSGWVSTTTPQTVENIYRRSFEVRDVSRDPSSDDIVSTGGVYDPQTKKIIVKVSWRTSRGITATDTIETYLPNLFQN